MSFTATHESGRARHVCQHALCFECFRSERARQRANSDGGADLPTALPLRGPSAGAEPPSLSARQVAHRQAMLAYCARRGQSVTR